MATAPISDESLLSLLKKSFPDATVDPHTDAAKASSTLFPDAHYTDSDKAEIDQWLITASHVASGNEDQAKHTERLSSLNTHLSSRTTLLGSKPSVADIALYSKLAPVVAKWTPEERTGEQGYHHIVRHVDFVQNSPVFGLKLEESDKAKVDPTDIKFTIKPIDAKAEKERKKKEKEAAAAAAAAGGATETSASGEQGAESGKKSKKEKAKEKTEQLGNAVASAVGKETPTPAGEGTKKAKQPKQPKNAPAPEKPLSPCLIDLRVGHILKAVQHPDADSLYVSTIAVGDAPGTDDTSEYEGQVVRTVCSGLNGLVPLEEMQNRKIVAVCNLKPVKMRGIKSAAMVLAASPRLKEGEVDNHAGPVELVNPPADAKAGERVYFEGWEGDPEPVLNPKKKQWETLQPAFTTTDDLEVGFDAATVPQLEKTGVGKLRTKEGSCKVTTLKGATVR